MIKLQSIVLALILAGGAFGAAVRQKPFVGFNDAKDADFTRFPEKKVSARRIAFPYATRALAIDLQRPMRPEKIVLPLHKLTPASPETESGAAGLKVFAGNDPQALQPVSAPQITVTSATVDGAVVETVTVTGLPEARYFQLYAPRTKPSYVYGLLDAMKEVEVWADAPVGPDPAIADYPELKTLDSDWLKTALPLAGCGFQDLIDDAAAATQPYRGQGGTSQIGWPWKRRVIEFALNQPADVGRIVLDLEKMEAHRPETATGLEKAIVYVSDDGQKFQAVTPVVTTAYYRIGNVVYARVTLAGKFPGRFFRIYAPWNNAFYVYGTRRLNNAIKALPGTQAAIAEFAAPPSAGGAFPVSFKLNGIGKAAGTATIRDKSRNAVLWQKSFAAIPDGENFTATVDPGASSGILDLELILIEDGASFPLVRETRLRCNTADILLKPQTAEGWRNTAFRLGGVPTDFLTAEKAGAKAEFEVPTDGNFAIYATIRGRGGFKVKTPQSERDLALQLWHPADAADALAGESFAGAAALKKGDRITFEAVGSGAELGPVKLSPLSTEKMALYAAPPEVKPTVILHADGYSDFFFREVTPAELEQRIDNAKATGVFAYDWCVGTSAVNYPSKVATEFGQQKDVKFYRDGDRLAAERLQQLLSTGRDPIRILRDRSRADGLRFSVTQRANAYYTNGTSMNAQYLIDHPEFFMVGVDGRKHAQPSYAYPEIRKFYLDMIREIAAYKPDAIVIEFLRHPPFFLYDPPLVAEYTRRYGQCTPQDYMNDNWKTMIGEIMTEHLKNVRQAIDEISPGTALEISFDYQDYAKHGIDLPAILAAGLVDVISPGIYQIGSQKTFPLEPFTAMIRKSPRPVLLIPRVEATIYGGDPTPEEEKGLVKIERRNLSETMFKAIFAEFLAQGADGLRPFNAGSGNLARILADRSELKRFVVFEQPLLDIRTSVY